MDDDVLVCRCEEITAGEIRKAVREYGGTSVTEIKRRVRAGMGLCQGKTCSRLVTRIINEELSKAPSDVLPATSRPPIRPVTFGELMDGEEGGKHND
ncbi:MAG: (2Fe-2S)-binding protein [Lachnospiraceae bacterium]|nr:(2Fe-2S)-binding protein [Lachnospiraceae bacterium]MCI1726152.1 (2Fe-2S)-binding protein [Lachnospiraceae bacterium]